MSERELQRCGLERNAHFFAYIMQRIHPRQKLSRCILVIELAITGQNTGIESTSKHDTDTLFGAGIHEAQALLFQQRVTTGEHGGVDIEHLHGITNHFPLVDAKTNGFRRAFVAQLTESLESTARRQLIPIVLMLVAVGVRANVVDLENVGL